MLEGNSSLLITSYIEDQMYSLGLTVPQGLINIVSNDLLTTKYNTHLWHSMTITTTGSHTHLKRDKK